MNPVTWFEIPVLDFDKAKAFYNKILGIEIQSAEMHGTMMGFFPWEEGAMGTSGALVQGESYVPSAEGSMVYLAVNDIEGVLSRVDTNGGSTMTPKMSIGEHGFVAHFKDCEGNRVALHSKN